MSDTVGVPVNWVDTSDTIDWSNAIEPTTSNDVTLTYYGSSCNCVGGCTCHAVWYHWYPQWCYHETKIKLTMSDVEALREAARQNKAVKKALRKIGPYIEVEVDFP